MTDPSPHRDVATLASLAGRTAVVVGGGGHIGSVLADALAEQGAAVAVVDIDASRSTATAATLAARRGVDAFALAVDLTDEEATRRIPHEVLERTGRLDVLVHAAALMSNDPLPNWTTPFEEQGTEVWRQALEINLTSMFVLAQECAPALRIHGCGSVIGFGSIYGMVGPDWRIYDSTDMGNAAGYAASKGGIIQLTRWLATTLAPDIRVNCVSPGGVSRQHPVEFRRAYETRTPLRRMATEEDLKGATAFLASDLSAYVTGHNLVVDGGWTAW